MFLAQGAQDGYSMLPDRSMVREDADTFFVSAAVAANIDLFTPGRHSAPARYITAQRIFSGTRLEDVGRYPLATPFEVSLSIFRFGDDDARPALGFVQRFLRGAIDADPAKMIYLAPHELGLRDAVLASGVPVDHVLSWDRSIPMRLGKGRPEGHYVKLFMPYRHGLIPVATLGLMELDGKMAVDSALFLERFVFVRAGLHHWYEGPDFAPLVEAVAEDPTLAALEQRERYLWANHLRSIVALLWDGAKPSGKGPGHMIRKLVRQLAGTIPGKQLGAETVRRIGEAATTCMAHLGYDIAGADLAESVVKLLNPASSQIAGELRAFVDRLAQGAIDRAELEVWKGERGLQHDWMQKLATERGMTLPEVEQPGGFWLRNACYSFDPEEVIADPVGFLRAAEEHRMKGVK
ncbi:MAG TPA: hypothetical protein VGD80_37135 [Kofleriaceae bacterium]